MSETDNDGAQDSASTDPKQAQETGPIIGRIEWLDLTVHDAPKLRNFYKAVVGWTSDEVDMGSYADFNMNLPKGGETVAGVCHARGSNANLPNQWLVYVRVTSAAECEKRGGKILDGPRRMAGSNFCVIQDPAGACMALISD